jgi:hypothetical protein
MSFVLLDHGEGSSVQATHSEQRDTTRRRSLELIAIEIPGFPVFQSRPILTLYVDVERG